LHASERQNLIQALATVTAEKIADATDPLKLEIETLKLRIAEIEQRGIEYKGVWQKSNDYRRGSVVTWDGSMFCAIKDVTPGYVPGSAGDMWQLCVKRGRK
jgi:hypothetical protein